MYNFAVMGFWPLPLEQRMELVLIFKSFHEVNSIVARARTARDTSGTITFGRKDPEEILATLGEA